MTGGRQAVGRIAAAGVAARLTGQRLAAAGRSLLYVTRSESGAAELADAMRAMAPDIEAIQLVPWDCLPYDRIGPSAESMGKRMAALRRIRHPGDAPLLVIASLEALLQRVPPADIVAQSFLTVRTGTTIDPERLRRQALGMGYILDEIVDEPGEIAFREEMVDLFPPACSQPLRIHLNEAGKIGEIRTFDPVSQRSIETVETLVAGPASEWIEEARDEPTQPATGELPARSLAQFYGRLDTVFDGMTDWDICLASGLDERLTLYLDIIEEAREAFREGEGSPEKPGSLYLDRNDWDAALRAHRMIELDLGGIDRLPDFMASGNPRRAFSAWVQQQMASGSSVLVTGNDDRIQSLLRRLENSHGASLAVDDWQAAIKARKGTLLEGRFAIAGGFVDDAAHVAVVAVADVLGGRASSLAKGSALLAEPDLAVGDLVVHEDHGLGIFRALETIEIEGVARDAMRLDYHGEDSILVPIEEFGHVWRYGSDEGAITLERLHTDAWTMKKVAIAKDIRATAKHLIALASERQTQAADIIVPRGGDYRKFAARFPYAETPDQSQAIADVLADLSSGRPMNRLICGDVGFGKTEIALRATAAVALAGKQVVLLAPTTVLARQHFETFTRRFVGMGVEVAMLSRLVSASTARDVKERLKSGDISIVIGTQALLGKDVGYADLGLVTIDEEHRFGAKAKQQTGALAAGLHQLAMTATPIPRTLQSAMVGIQDVSILTTPPVRRRPIRTFRRAFDPALIKVALMREKRRGGQSFIVVPRIEDIDGLKQTLEKLVPELILVVAHGKTPAAEMDAAMVAFGRGEGDVLLSTNIIENGLDIPSANTMLIFRADLFGLAQLHQLRGRVGRGRSQGIVYLLTAEEEELSEQSAARLDAMVTHDRLGDGLAISARDLDQRGAGDLVGEDQAGHLKLIGVSLHQHMLASAVASLRGDALPNRRPPDINIGVVGAIPQDYVKDASVRINLYARLFKLTTSTAIEDFADELTDRFGDLPEATELLLQLAKLRITATASDIAKLDVGPLGAAVTFRGTPTAALWKRWTREPSVTQREGRLFAALETEAGPERLAKVSEWIASLGRVKRRRGSVAA